mgnify:CR=1 FL=1
MGAMISSRFVAASFYFLQNHPMKKECEHEKTFYFFERL